MALSELSEAVFRRGVGISRRYALGTARYHELCALYENEASEKDVQLAAEAHYLGERLSDRAFQNLPKLFRDAAVQWPSLDALQQQSILEMLVNRLRTAHWRKRRAVPQSSGDDPARALPRETGSWQRGKIQPNCLGLAQMLVGFARATGAEHFLLTPIVRSDHAAEDFLMRNTKQMLDLMSDYQGNASVRRLTRTLTMQYRRSLTALDMMQRDGRAHHALVIRRRDGEWWIVDPYMYQLNRFEEGDMPGVGETIIVCQQRAEMLPTFGRAVKECLQGIYNPDRQYRSSMLRKMLDFGDCQTKQQRRSKYVKTLVLLGGLMAIIAEDCLYESPPSFEVSPASLSIGLFTLNHCADMTTDVYGELSDVIFLQHLVRDACARVQTEGVGGTVRMLAILPALNVPSYGVLPELRPYTTKKGKKDDGRELASSSTGGGSPELPW